MLPHGRNIVARLLNAPIGDQSAMPSKLMPTVIGVPVGGGGGGGGGGCVPVSGLIVNQLNEGVTGVEPKLVVSTPAFAVALKALALVAVPIVTHFVSSLEFRRYWAVIFFV